MKAPIIRQISLLSFLYHGAVVLIFLFFTYKIAPQYAAIITFGVYYTLVLTLRKVFTKHQLKGMKFVKKGLFEKAIPHFKNSVKFFNDHPSIDLYRVFALMSLSKMTYREMALCNIAFCYSQIKMGTEAKLYYNQVITEYPENTIAKSALNMFDSIEK